MANNTVSISLFLERPASLEDAGRLLDAACGGVDLRSTVNANGDEAIIVKFTPDQLAVLNEYEPLLTSSLTRIAFEEVVDLSRFAWTLGFVHDMTSDFADQVIVPLARSLGNNSEVIIGVFPDNGEDPYVRSSLSDHIA